MGRADARITRGAAPSATAPPCARVALRAAKPLSETCRDAGGNWEELFSLKCPHASKQEAVTPGQQTELLLRDTYPARGEEEEEQGPGRCAQVAKHPEEREGRGFRLPDDSVPLLPLFGENSAPAPV